MQKLLLRLITELEAIGRIHEELFDSDVREAMGGAIMQGFVRHIEDYEITDNLGMFTSSANKDVKQSLVRYVNEANHEAKELGLGSFHSRLAAFQDSAVTLPSPSGFDYEELFGHTPPEYYDAEGIVIWDRVRKIKK